MANACLLHRLTALASASIFTPVYPVAMYPDYTYWARPLDAWVFLLIVPALAFPVAVTHFALCHYVAMFLTSNDFRRRITFSLKSMMLLVAALSPGFMLIANLGGDGFLIAFYIVSIFVASANIWNWNTIGGIDYPRMNQSLAWTLC